MPRIRSRRSRAVPLTFICELKMILGSDKIRVLQTLGFNNLHANIFLTLCQPNCGVGRPRRTVSGYFYKYFLNFKFTCHQVPQVRPRNSGSCWKERSSIGIKSANDRPPNARILPRPNWAPCDGMLRKHKDSGCGTGSRRVG